MHKAAGLLGAIAICTSLFAVEEYEVDNAIARARRELEKVAAQREETAAAAARDRAEFAAYQERTGARIERLEQETDSIRARIGFHQRESDSLAAELGSLRARERDFDLARRRLREQLVRCCDTLLAIDSAMSPLLAEALYEPLEFLRSELAAGAVDNAEAMHRLVSIADDFENRLLDIEILQGRSPSPHVTGVAYRLRIGGVFEAAVDAEGRRAAVWDRAAADWIPLGEDAAGRILEAVNIREGKAVPSIVELPFDTHREEARQ
jgi:hypothetical protein